MTPQEKATELYNKFYDLATVVIDIKIKKYVTKQCCLIAVDEIIASNPIAFDEDDNCIEKQWWQEVKTEIEKI